MFAILVRELMEHLSSFRFAAGVLTHRFRRQVFEAILAADAEDEESEHRYQPWSCGGKHFSHRDVDLGPAKVFADPPGTSAQVLQAASLDVILLACYNVVLFLVTFAVFMRQDVTVGSAR